MCHGANAKEFCQRVLLKEFHQCAMSIRALQIPLVIAELIGLST
jgi:hypothetical protein